MTISNLRKKIKPYSEVPLSRRFLLNLLKDYKRPNDKISNLIKKNHLISLKRGLYMVGPEIDLPSPNQYLIANHLNGPSYITLESALSYWNMIPERVYEISSATLNNAKVYKTSRALFKYYKLTTPYYSYGIKTVNISSKQSILIATPEKAICDKIILTQNVNLRSVKQSIKFLIEDLRISDIDTLKSLDTKIIGLWIAKAPKSSSLKMFLKSLKKL